MHHNSSVAFNCVWLLVSYNSVPPPSSLRNHRKTHVCVCVYVCPLRHLTPCQPSHFLLQPQCLLPRSQNDLQINSHKCTSAQSQHCNGIISQASFTHSHPSFLRMTKQSVYFYGNHFCCIRVSLCVWCSEKLMVTCAAVFLTPLCWQQCVCVCARW